ncbi:hypothetical protein OEZ86_010235 [Tetradesmus obliquus]|nr:hypothetical protein OEZ86_010235 [Tetradesmus obliquus]
MIYGTAWKKERTAELVEQAVLAGFRGIDTACQPKHYREDLVGVALLKLQQAHSIPRSELFIQTKFTPIAGQDRSQPLPYDPAAPLPEQVRQSFATSQRNLHTQHIDSLVLHSPLPSHSQSMEVWRAFEELADAGQVGQLGISNIYDLQALQAIFEQARVKPAVVQNRFHATTGHDAGIRAWCRKQGVTYQSFWTLTANPDAPKSAAVRAAAKQRGCEPEQESASGLGGCQWQRRLGSRQRINRPAACRQRVQPPPAMEGIHTDDVHGEHDNMA